MSGETPNSEKFDVRPFLYRLPGFVLDGLLSVNKLLNVFTVSHFSFGKLVIVWNDIGCDSGNHIF